MRRIVPLVFLLACGADAPPPAGESTPPAITTAGPDETASLPEQAAISTDRTRYSIVTGPHGDEVSIRSTLTAPPDQTFFVVNCNGQISTGLQAERNGKWEDVWVGLTNQCLSEPIVLPPGTSHSYETLITLGSGSVIDSNEPIPPPGAYRVIWYGTLRSFDAITLPFGDPVPESMRTSKPIHIE